VEEIARIPIPERDEKSKPIFLVARSFDINRPGAEVKNLKGGVLGGVLKKGKLNVCDEIEIKPGLSMKKAHRQVYQTLEAKIISLHKGSESVSSVSPGASISIETSLDPFLTKTDSLTGCVVSSKGNLPEKVFGTSEPQKVEPIKMQEMLMLNINTTITVGTVEKISRNHDEIELSLNIPAIALKDDNVGIARNIGGHWRLIGWGEVAV